jgi:hypothetical protein
MDVSVQKLFGTKMSSQLFPLGVGDESFTFFHDKAQYLARARFATPILRDGRTMSVCWARQWERDNERETSA